jgi:hypothetical protein
VAEGARLESVFRGNSNVGSNPTLSATTITTNRYIPRIYSPAFDCYPYRSPTQSMEAKRHTARVLTLALGLSNRRY